MRAMTACRAARAREAMELRSLPGSEARLLRPGCASKGVRPGVI